VYLKLAHDSSLIQYTSMSIDTKLMDFKQLLSHALEQDKEGD